MKKQTLEIEIPDGFMVDNFDQASGKIKLKAKPKSVMERIKTVADVLSDNGLTEKEFHDQCKCAGLDEDEIAYRILKMLVISLNEGWKPDWNNGEYDKYFAWFYMGGSSGFRYYDYGHWYSSSTVGSRLCFKSAELAKYAGTQFTEVFKQFMVIE